MENKVILLVLDGWGHNETEITGDAIRDANPYWMNFLMKKYPSLYITAHGEAVGLHKDQMGNSEVGHLTLGAGRVIVQEIVKIDKAIETDTLKNNLEILDSESSKRLHIVGLLSDGGVHSHINHIKALIKDVPNEEVYLHAILDGRDTEPRSAIKYIREIQEYMKKIGKGKLASVSGRYYSMDRDRNDERTEEAYNMMTNGKCDDLIDVEDVINEFYKAGITDEFIKPSLLVDNGRIFKDDVVFFANFRADRSRQILIKMQETNSCYSMTEYHKSWISGICFEKEVINETLSEVISKHGLRQIHIAETEKYAHVTYFFNGGKENLVPLEDRNMIHSVKTTSVDLVPEMSTLGIAEASVQSIQNGFKFILSNIAAPDMVGHTGNYEATIKAIKTTDEAIGLIYYVAKKEKYTLIITADHGNAEIMFDEHGNPSKKHTENKVPFIFCEGENHLLKIPSGIEYSLKDVAPTILKHIGIKIPNEMTGRNILEYYDGTI